MKSLSYTSPRKSLLKAALSLMLLSSFTTVIFGQSQASAQTGCASMDASKPQLSISYERAGEGEPNYKGESRQRVWLRLHNNTNCALFIITASAKLTRLPDNKITFDLQEGAEIIVHYDVEDKQKGKAPTPAYPRGDSGGSLSRLPPGRSIVFSVPLPYFKKQFDIAVPFRYESEGIATPGEGLVVHRVYFDTDKLPKELLQQTKKQSSR